MDGVGVTIETGVMFPDELLIAWSDETWGRGNWIRCLTCPRDDTGRQVFHHKDAHGFAPRTES